MNGPSWSLSDDRKTITVLFPSSPPVALIWDTAQVDEHLKQMGEMRAAMLPEPPREFVQGQKVEAVADPIWSTEPELMGGDSLLHVRDPRFGWLHYLIPRNTAGRLAAFLKAQSDSPPPTQPPTNKAH